MRDKAIFGDALCFCLAPSRTRETIYSVLDKFVPGYKKIDGDYSFNLQIETTFDDEDQILTHLEVNKTERGTIHWNTPIESLDNVTVGAYFTSDEQLILSVTVLGDGQKEETYFNDLKTILHSSVGLISYNQIPDFKDGEDFKNKYGPQRRS
jgi:hypothetical protein